MLEELGVGVAAVKAADNEGNASTESQAEMIQRFKAFYFKSRVYRRAAARLKALETLSGEEESIEYSVSRAGLGDRQASYSVSVAAAALPTDASTIQQKDAPSLWYQYKLVQARSFISYWRNPPFMFARMVVLLILSLLFSVLYFDLNVTEQSQVMSAISSRTVSCLFAGVIIGGTSLPVMMRTRAVFIRERSSSMYNAGLWSAAATVTELFWMIWCAFIFQLPLYFMVGMKSTVAAFFQFYLALYTTMAAFLALTQLNAAVAPDIIAAQVIAGMYYGNLFTFSGVTIQAPSVPAGWVWFFNMLPISHLTDFIVSTQLDEENTLIAVQAGTQIIDVPVSTYVAQFMGLSYEGNWNSFGWAMLFIVVVQALAFFATKKLVTAKR
jgi:ABC-type multidrug transport system permease subunit